VNRSDSLLSMREVSERLGFTGSKGLYRLIQNDPDFITFKVGDAYNAPRRMRESALRAWIAKREAREGK